MLALDWMAADAPYMPIATAGLLAVVSEIDPLITAYWVADGRRSRLRLDCALDIDGVATALVDAPLPDIGAPAWPTTKPQGLGPSLQTTPDPLGSYRTLLASAGPLEARLLRALATDQVLDQRPRSAPELKAARARAAVTGEPLDDSGVPSRTRLLRGAKSDLSAFNPLKRPTVEQLADELRSGPSFKPASTGSSLGLVPELQTFGGTTGRNPSGINASSALLSRLLLHGILALPPGSGTRRGRRVVGGPLVTADGVLSWPRWTIPVGLRALRVLFSLAAVHAPAPDGRALRARGIDAVYRSVPTKISTTVAVFRWGSRVV